MASPAGSAQSEARSAALPSGWSRSACSDTAHSEHARVDAVLCASDLHTSASSCSSPGPLVAARQALLPPPSRPTPSREAARSRSRAVTASSRAASPLAARTPCAEASGSPRACGPLCSTAQRGGGGAATTAKAAQPRAAASETCTRPARAWTHAAAALRSAKPACGTVRARARCNMRSKRRRAIAPLLTRPRAGCKTTRRAAERACPGARRACGERRPVASGPGSATAGARPHEAGIVPLLCSFQASPWRAATASRPCRSPTAAACNKRAARACAALRSRSLAPCVRRSCRRSAGRHGTTEQRRAPMHRAGRTHSSTPRLAACRRRIGLRRRHRPQRGRARGSERGARLAGLRLAGRQPPRAPRRRGVQPGALELGARACAAPWAATAAAAMSRARSSCPRSARTTCASSLPSVRNAASSCTPRAAGRLELAGWQQRCAVQTTADQCGSAEHLPQARQLPHAGLGRRVACGGDLGSLCCARVPSSSQHHGSRPGAQPGPACAYRAVRDKVDRRALFGTMGARISGQSAGPVGSVCVGDMPPAVTGK